MSRTASIISLLSYPNAISAATTSLAIWVSSDIVILRCRSRIIRCACFLLILNDSNVSWSPFLMASKSVSVGIVSNMVSAFLGPIPETVMRRRNDEYSSCFRNPNNSIVSFLITVCVKRVHTSFCSIFSLVIPATLILYPTPPCVSILTNPFPVSFAFPVTVPIIQTVYWVLFEVVGV